jgi:homoserine O-acetyltransferase
MSLFPGERRDAGPVTLAYETYGRLNADRSNAILILPRPQRQRPRRRLPRPTTSSPGWWDECIGPGKAFDTDRYFVICSNVLGSCYGSSGPSSLDPATGAAVWPALPRGHRRRHGTGAGEGLLDHLGIDRLLCAAGGSMGGMQVLEWAAHHPQRLRAAIPLATTARNTARC